MRRRLAKWTLIGTGVAGVLFLLFSCSKGGLGYFSPDTFQMRTQSEILCAPLSPLVEFPIYRSAFHAREEPYELVTYLVEKSYWEPVETDQPTWVLMFHWNNRWRDGESVLYRYMTYTPDFWIEWSEANPELAQVLWPKVLEIIRNGQMDGSAEWVMNLAQQSSSVDEFQFRVNHDPELQSVGISMP